MLPCVCSGIDRRWRQNVLKTKKWLIGRRVSLILLRHFEVCCDLLLDRRMATRNLFVLHNKEAKEKTNDVSYAFVLPAGVPACRLAVPYFTATILTLKSISEVHMGGWSLFIGIKSCKGKSCCFWATLLSVIPLDFYRRIVDEGAAQVNYMHRNRERIIIVLA